MFPAMVRASAAALLALTAAPPPAHAATVELLPPLFTYQQRGTAVFVVAACAGFVRDANASQIMVECTVDDTHLEVSVYDASSVTVSGSAAAAVWLGGVQTPATVCSYAQAWFNQSSGQPPVIVTAGPICREITAHGGAVTG